SPSIGATRTSLPTVRFKFVRGLVLIEVGLTALEIVLLVAPTLALAAQSLRASGEAYRMAAIVAALVVLSWVRAVDLLRPVIAARNAKQAGHALDDGE